MGLGTKERHGEAFLQGLGRRWETIPSSTIRVLEQTVGRQHVAAEHGGELGTWCLEKPGRNLGKEPVNEY